MSRLSPVKIDCDNAQKDLQFALDEALAKPDDEQLFYTASLHFLNKRLQEKAHLSAKDLSSRSCCQLTRAEQSVGPAGGEASRRSDRGSLDPPAEGPSLSMYQLLPFPKSNKDSLLVRFMKTFRKYRRTADIPETNNSCDAESSKHISNFKFPRCARRTKFLHPSCLVKISEEASKESVKTSYLKDFSCEGDVL